MPTQVVAHSNHKYILNCMRGEIFVGTTVFGWSARFLSLPHQYLTPEPDTWRDRGFPDRTQPF